MDDPFVTVPAGYYQQGSDRHYPEERPARDILLAAFRIAILPVTNADFARFVAETRHVTAAELADRPGSAVFKPTNGPVDLNDPAAWWDFVDGACWLAPEGPGSTIDHRADHPVVHVAQADARAYAAWAGARLPTEAEWEVAARGRLVDADYAWGNDLLPGDRLMANIWTGSFPWYFARGPGAGTSAVGAFPANGFGIRDMIGNVWEWTLTSPGTSCGADVPAQRRCCAPVEDDADLIVLKGGSFLCAAEYCQRYRPAARIAVARGMTSAHIGFRLARDI